MFVNAESINCNIFFALLSFFQTILIIRQIVFDGSVAYNHNLKATLKYIEYIFFGFWPNVSIPLKMSIWNCHFLQQLEFVAFMVMIFIPSHYTIKFSISIISYCSHCKTTFISRKSFEWVPRVLRLYSNNTSQIANIKFDGN